MPESAYNILNKQLINVDLPAPVRPTTPTFSAFYIFNDIYLITNGNPYLYLAEYLLNYILPFWIANKLAPYYLVLHFWQYYL